MEMLMVCRKSSSEGLSFKLELACRGRIWANEKEYSEVKEITTEGSEGREEGRRETAGVGQGD